MPETITQGAHSASFLHDMDHQRIKQISTDRTTLYVRAFRLRSPSSCLREAEAASLRRRRAGGQVG